MIDLSFLNIFITIVVIEGLTEIVVKSKISEPIRNKLGVFRERSKFLTYVTTPLFCPHCFSVWASLFITSIVFIFSGQKVLYIFILVLFFHRLSNYLHMIVDRVDKFYKKKE